MACVEPVVEDLYVVETSAHPDIYKKCRRQNAIVESTDLKGAHDQIEQQNRMELKRIAQEKAILSRELRKLIIDRSVVKRSDMAPDFPMLRQRRKSREFEDITLPSSQLSASSNLTAFVKFGRTKAPIVKTEVIKRAMSDQKLNNLKDLKMYQHWEGDPDAINSVRREKKNRTLQLEQLNFSRTRKYDSKNEPMKATVPHFLSRQNSLNKLPRPSSGGTPSDAPAPASKQSKAQGAPSKLAATQSKPTSAQSRPSSGQSKSGAAAATPTNPKDKTKADKTPTAEESKRKTTPGKKSYK